MMKRGDCYQAAAMLLLNMGSGSGATLVHGTVVGEGRLDGYPYGHAWIEINGTVLDPSNGRTICMGQEAYYARGRIEPGSPRRYSWREALEGLVDSEHYGPWEETRP